MTLQMHPLGGRTVEVKDGAPLAVGLERLTMLREKRVPLSNYSIDLLALDDLEMQADFVKRVTAGESKRFCKGLPLGVSAVNDPFECFAKCTTFRGTVQENKKRK